MNKNLLINQDSQLQQSWWNFYKTNQYETSFTIDESDKLDILKTLHSSLYGELRDKHSRQQQVVAWGFTILTGGGFITLVISDALSMLGVIIFSISLAFLTFALTRTIGLLSKDRMSIARQLDRIHQVMRVFEEGSYYKGGTLFDPVWYGWGFDEARDANWELSKYYQMVLWIIYVSDVLILLNKAGLVFLF
jgi:hypothetical protein